MTGSFSFPGFLKMMRRWAGVCQEPRKYDEVHAEEDIREAFKIFDVVSWARLRPLQQPQDGDGFITRPELGYVIDNIGVQMSRGDIEVTFSKCCPFLHSLLEAKASLWFTPVR